MDKIVAVNLNMFTLNQLIMIIDNDTNTTIGHSVTIDELPSVLVATCRNHNINNVKLIGNKNYAEEISQEIQIYANQNFSNLNLNIKITED